MAETSEKGLPEPPLAGSEIETLLGSLERQRATLAWKCGGLDADGLRARLEPSAITLGGLLKHLTFMEDTNFSWPGRARTVAPWDSGDWDSDPDWEWHSAAEDSPEQLMSLWRDAVARSRAVVFEAVAEGGLEHQARFVALHHVAASEIQAASPCGEVVDAHRVDVAGEILTVVPQQRHRLQG